MRFVLIAALIAGLAACGEAGPLKVDGSSKEAAESSIAAMGQALPPDRKAELDAAIDMGWPLSQIAGKTADEIVAMARAKMIAELRDVTIPALQAKIVEAEAAVAASKEGGGATRGFLRGISLLKPELTWREANGTPTPLLTFNMKNDTSEAIQTIVFRAQISAPGREKAFIDQRFEFKFAEPVTTGETKFVFVNPDLTQPGNTDALESQVAEKLTYDVDFVRVADLNGRVIMDDEGPAKAEADLLAAKDALLEAELELERLEAGGAIAG